MKDVNTFEKKLLVVTFKHGCPCNFGAEKSVRRRRVFVLTNFYNRRDPVDVHVNGNEMVARNVQLEQYATVQAN